MEPAALLSDDCDPFTFRAAAAAGTRSHQDRGFPLGFRSLAIHLQTGTAHRPAGGGRPLPHWWQSPESRRSWRTWRVRWALVLMVAPGTIYVRSRETVKISPQHTTSQKKAPDSSGAPGAMGFAARVTTSRSYTLGGAASAGGKSVPRPGPARARFFILGQKIHAGPAPPATVNPWWYAQ